MTLRNWHDQAVAAQRLGNLEEAEHLCRQALEAAPSSFAALHMLGMLRARSGDTAGALELIEAALRQDPGAADALNDWARILWTLGRFDEALAGFDAALAAKPDHLAALCNRGTTLRDMLRLDEALQTFDRAIAVDPASAAAYRGKSFCALLSGDFAQGLPLYEWRKRLSPPVELRDYAQPLWTGCEDIQGKTVFVYIEQGLGDTIQFYRLVTPLLERGAHVILAAQNGLKRLLESATTKVTLVDSKSVPAVFDYHVPLMSLPLALGLTVDSIPAIVPYLRAEPARVARWKARIGEKGFKIGISWQGAGGQTIAGRAMPLTSYREISHLEGVRLISLQKGFGSEQLAGLPRVESLGEEFDSGPDAFLDSAAAMECLDLVITLDSAVAHLAGALGRPVWVALKRVPEWRWLLDRSDSPWYPTMRLFRQKTENDWTLPFADMQMQLRRLSIAPA